VTAAAFTALGSASRRRILELLADGEQSVGTLVTALAADRAMSQPAVSQHLRALRDAGLVQVRAEGTRHLYALDPAGLERAAAWLTALAQGAPFAQPLDALATELSRGRRTRRRAGDQRRAGSAGA
jgi:DNA-binding transcriptional ArsR family regulator